MQDAAAIKSMIEFNFGFWKGQHISVQRRVAFADV